MEAKAHHHAEHKEKKNHFWPAVSAVLAILLLFSIFSGQVPTAKLNEKDFAVKTTAFIQDYLVQAPMKVAIDNITEEKGLYKFSVLIDDKYAGTSYATKDGALIMLPNGVIDVEKFKEQAKQLEESGANQEPAAQEPIKSDKPKVQLFVMSQCPYGVQAENAIKPVLDALKGKVSFELRFIANSDGAGGFTSLHGQAEVDEDIRQVCAAKYAPSTYMNYVICRNKNIRSTDWQACATEANIDSAKIKTCSEGAEGKTLLSDNIKAGDELGVGSSPTIIINSQNYQGQRTADAFLEGICAAFNNAPQECSQALNASSSDTAVPAGGCGA